MGSGLEKRAENGSKVIIANENGKDNLEGKVTKRKLNFFFIESGRVQNIKNRLTKIWLL